MRIILALLVIGSALFADEKKKNVIVILADDLGYADLGCQGNAFHETPNLDQLARDGLRYSTAYSACTVCSPTRAALITGQHPARLHITDWIPGHENHKAKLDVPKWEKRLLPQHFTLAKAFKDSGYATASIGKWHLGNKDFYPEKHGFDINIAGTDKGQPPSYFSPFNISTLKDAAPGEFLTDALTREACDWVAKQTKPFFLYLSHFAVHTPLAGKPEVIEKYRKKAERLGLKKNPTYAALVESLDDSLGTIRSKLFDLKLENDTVIIFTSDNGGLIGTENNPVTTNSPFRAGKGSPYEGGVRVPFIVYWPGEPTEFERVGGLMIQNNREHWDGPVVTMDIYWSLVRRLDLKAPKETFEEFLSQDGQSITFPFKDRGQGGGVFMKISQTRPIYWHYPHYHPGGATPYSAVREGDWKLIEFLEDNSLELYNLKDDPGELKNMSVQESKTTLELLNQLKKWRTKIGVQMPTPKPKP